MTWYFKSVHMDIDRIEMDAIYVSVDVVHHQIALSKSKMAIRFSWNVLLDSKVSSFLSATFDTKIILENDSGCRICRCRDPHEQSIGPRPKSRDCIWNNSRKKEGEMWLAECHLCFCYSGNGFEHGTVMCSLLKCPNLKEIDDTPYKWWQIVTDNIEVKVSPIIRIVAIRDTLTEVAVQYVLIHLKQNSDYYHPMQWVKTQVLLWSLEWILMQNGLCHVRTLVSSWEKFGHQRAVWMTSVPSVVVWLHLSCVRITSVRHWPARHLSVYPDHAVLVALISNI